MEPADVPGLARALARARRRGGPFIIREAGAASLVSCHPASGGAATAASAPASRSAGRWPRREQHGRHISSGVGRRGLRCLHAITGLGTGGAEWMLYRVLAEGDPARFAPTVMSLMTPARRPGIARLDVPIATLDMREGLRLSLPVLRLRRLAGALQPDLVQGWMYHGNPAATAAWWCLEQRRPLVWTVHHSAADITNEKLSTRLSVRLSARLSPLTAAIAYCSSESARQHHGSALTRSAPW